MTIGYNGVMRQLVLIAHDIRSCHNVGSLLRTAEGLGIHRVYLTGYTPYPLQSNDTRLPHIAQKMQKQIAKTALGAEEMVDWRHHESVARVIDSLKQEGFSVVGLEQSPNAVPLPEYSPPKKTALLLGREVEGIAPDVLRLCDQITEIPMVGKKESFNVVQAAAMALFHFSFHKA